MNPSTGKFTAPVAGYYFIKFQGMSGGVDWARVHILKNGKTVSTGLLDFPNMDVSLLTYYLLILETWIK